MTRCTSKGTSIFSRSISFCWWYTELSELMPSKQLPRYRIISFLLIVSKRSILSMIVKRRVNIMILTNRWRVVSIKCLWNRRIMNSIYNWKLLNTLQSEDRGNLSFRMKPMTVPINVLWSTFLNPLIANTVRINLLGVSPPWKNKPNKLLTLWILRQLNRRICKIPCLIPQISTKTVEVIWLILLSILNSKLMVFML